jgi:catechol 2,3-dioxygenase-like lactoylglutathione lyase family enzyme
MADAAPVLGQLNVVARDFDATIAFYRRLGVPLAEHGPAGGVRHAEATLANGFVLELDDLNLARTYNAAWRRPGGSSRALIGFSVGTRRAVDARYAELVAAGYEGRQPPYDAFWGARYAVVADPDGNDVGIMSPPEASRRSWPPQESPAP